MKIVARFAFLLALHVSLVEAQVPADKFVYLHKVIPTIKLDMRYFSTDNFMGTRVDGYKRNVALFTHEAATALKKVQFELEKDGMGLKVFDSYRPQKGVNHFIRWAKVLADTLTKQKYYPDVRKADLFDLGYIAERSGHTRGSTLDLTVVKLESGLELDMGAPWDFFGEISHHGTNLINKQQQANRDILSNVMKKFGFRYYPNEWWHYTLENEPFPDTYFNFNIE